MQQWTFRCSEGQWTWRVTDADGAVRESPRWFATYVSMLTNAMSAGSDPNAVTEHIYETAPLRQRSVRPVSGR